MKQNKCCVNNRGSQVNSLLLEYFIQSELHKSSSAETTSVSNDSKDASLAKEEGNKDTEERDSSREPDAVKDDDK